jgi:hypothetical protein
MELEVVQCPWAGAMLRCYDVGFKRGAGKVCTFEYPSCLDSKRSLEPCIFRRWLIYIENEKRIYEYLFTEVCGMSLGVMCNEQLRRFRDSEAQFGLLGE